MKKLVPFLIISFLVFSCKPKNERALVISKIRKASKLATVEMIVTKVIAAKKSPKGLRRVLGVKDATFLADTEATIKAGIDFSKIKPKNLKIEEGKIDIILPPVEILNFSYPAENFHVNEYVSDTRPLLNKISIEEIDDFYRQAETDIRANFKYFEVRNTVEIKTRRLLGLLLTQLGFEEVNIEFENEGKSEPLDISAEDPEGGEVID